MFCSCVTHTAKILFFFPTLTDFPGANKMSFCENFQELFSKPSKGNHLMEPLIEKGYGDTENYFTLGPGLSICKFPHPSMPNIL